VGNTINKKSTAIIIIVVASVAAVAVLGAFVLNGDDDNSTYKVTYYKNGNKISERTVSAGTLETISEFASAKDASDRFVGWNTQADLSGETLKPGTRLTVNRDISLHAMVVSSGVYAIILPAEQEGYTITAEPSTVVSGGESVLTYRLMPSHMEEDLVISVNDNPMKLDAMGKIYLEKINSDQIVTVTGVYDKTEHSITLPKEQTGYVLTASAEKVHDKQTYALEFRLLKGYKETSDFGIHINGGDAKIPTDGVILIEDVRDNHLITVTGVEPILYSVSSGKNVTVLVNGTAASKATVEDDLTVVPADGYTIPATFDSQIRGEHTVSGGIYRITDNISFPSVLKITVGDNVKIGNSTSKTVFVCPGDLVKIGPASGYSAPDNYANKVGGLSGVRSASGGFYFSEDAILPSIYRVDFYGYTGVFETFWVIGGTAVPFVESAPKRVAYNFGGWDVESTSIVNSNLSIHSIWNPITYNVYFGPNLVVSVGKMTYTFIQGSSTPPRTIQIRSDESVVIRTCFDLSLPDDYCPQAGIANYMGGHYEIIGDCSFPGVTYVGYLMSDGSDGPSYSVTIGSYYTPLSEPVDKKEGCYFLGWLYEGKLIIGQIKIENEVYLLSASWR